MSWKQPNVDARSVEWEPAYVSPNKPYPIAIRKRQKVWTVTFQVPFSADPNRVHETIKELAVELRQRLLPQSERTREVEDKDVELGSLDD